MKTFLFLLAFTTSFGASAQVYVNPQIINLGHSVQVQIYNTTETDINCSGSVYMHTRLGRMETGYYFDQVRKGFFSMRTFYLMSTNPSSTNQIAFTSHSIYCNKVL
jgi:hypothetical protein